MRKLLTIALAALMLPASAIAQTYTYAPDQGGAVGTVVMATMPNGQPPLRVVLPNSLVARGIASRLDITASTLVASGVHQIATLCVITAGSTAGTLNDSATTGGAATANEVAAIPNAVGCNQLDWPMANGIVVVPGTGQAVSISYN